MRELLERLEDGEGTIIWKQTADNKSVGFHDDGVVTGPMGYYIRGVRKVPSVVFNWLMGDVSLYDYNELPVVLKAARKLAKKKPGAMPGDFRSVASAALKKE